MRVTLVISSMASGGAERVMAVIANHWSTHGAHVTLITLAATAEDRQRLASDIRRVALDLTRRSHGLLEAFGNNGRRVRRLRREIRASEPDIVISFLPATNVLTLLATRNLRIPVIVAERIDPREEPIAPVWALLRRLLYPFACAVVVQTTDVSRWALRFIAHDRIHVIPNPVAPIDWGRMQTPECRDAPGWLAGPGHKVFAVGRLTKQKGFDLLLPAFARCRATFPEWSLVILGEGEERARLEHLASELGIASAVTLPGHVPDAAALLRHGDLFVLSSRYEGFPNALLEAMACGLPVISTDCPSGPRQIIRDGVDGVLVPRDSVDALSTAMLRLMGAPGARKQLGARAVDVAERFSVSRVTRQWNELLTNCACTVRSG